MTLSFSIIIPVYNRPQEIDELLQSLTKQDFSASFEVVVIEDGSTNSCKSVVEQYTKKLNINYYFKENSGAGTSRNFGMQKATGNYFIILDSDVLVPKDYLQIVKNRLQEKYTDAFGGPDAAHSSFTNLQKAINYSMTSFLTTGGIRGKKNGVGRFQLRSFNLGISKKAFEATQGFLAMKTGEDIDLTFRLWESGFETQLVSEAFVYHKRRTSIKQFFKQTYGFGTARPLLNRKYPQSKKPTFWFPSLFTLGFLLSLVLLYVNTHFLFDFYFFYLFLIACDAWLKNHLNPFIAVLSVLTSLTQFLGYGLGFLHASFFSKLSYKSNLY